MAQLGAIMAEEQDLLEQILEEEVVVRRTFEMLPARNCLLQGVEVEGVIIVYQSVVMVGI